MEGEYDRVVTGERLNAIYSEVRLSRLLGGLPLGPAAGTVALLLAGLLLRVAALGAVALAEGFNRAAAAAGVYLPGVSFALCVAAACTGLVLALRAAALAAVWLVDGTDTATASLAARTWTPGGRS
ncbi:MAG: hypothetical protein GEV11_18825 [Streptosporangiales bacterium]|nr:hypothetical protein [Streptosporangiales bacterium]